MDDRGRVVLHRRTPLRAKTPLKPGKGLRRVTSQMKRTPIRAVNPERRDRLFREQYGSEERVDFIHAEPCYVSGEAPPVESSHTPSRGAGGKKVDQVPMKARLHRELHQIGERAFEARHGVDLRELASECDRRYREMISCQ